MSEIKYVDTYIDMTDQDLARELVGKKIVKINTEYNTITLHDGTVLKFNDVSDCCAWFEAELEEKNLTDNAITRVTTSGQYDDESWTIHILAADKNIADVHIRGDEGTGYYCQSIELEILKTGE